jgi:hypothetical protein
MPQDPDECLAGREGKNHYRFRHLFHLGKPAQYCFSVRASLGTVRFQVPCGEDRNCSHAALNKQADLLNLHSMCFQQLVIPFEIHECEVRIWRHYAH